MPCIRLFYGTKTGNTEYVATLIQAAMSDLLDSVANIANAHAADLSHADVLLLGTSTWEGGTLQEDWARFLPTLKQIDLHGKKVALFGLGDGHAFSGLFVNGLRILYDIVKAGGAEVIGRWPVAGYDYEHSQAIEGDHFVGLVIDIENSSDLTVQRVSDWVALLRRQIKAVPHHDDCEYLG